MPVSGLCSDTTVDPKLQVSIMNETDNNNKSDQSSGEILLRRRFLGRTATASVGMIQKQ
jgi:hypothetical protein